MSFLSRFASRKGKDRSSKRSPSDPSAPSSSAQTRQDLLPLTLPTSSLLADASRANPLLLSPTSHAGARSHAALDADDDDLRSLRSVDTTPWVHVDAATAADSPVKPRPGAPSTPHRERRERVDPAREKRERVRLERARLGPAEVTLLLDECGGVIRSRGLTTLGLFRPYRASESRSAIRALCLAFLDYVAECAASASRGGGPGVDGSGGGAGARADDARGTEASKAVLLHAFREELRYAGVHDVVAVLKWGLRHLVYPPGTSFAGRGVPSLDFYTTFVARTTPVLPPLAFSAFLLPSLPPASQSLLLSALGLIQAVAAHAQENAMPAHRLCRLFAAYLFGVHPAASTATLSSSTSTSTSFDTAHEQFCRAGDALEGMLRASLAEQTDLPPRLAELVDAPAAAGREREHERTVRVLRVELETRGEWDAATAAAAGEGRINNQDTGRAAALPRAPGHGGSTAARRMPLDVLRDALALESVGGGGGDGDAAAQVWDALRACASAQDGRPEALLDGEVVRVLDLVGLGAAGDGGEVPFALLGGGGAGGARGRTMSHNAADAGTGVGQGELGSLAGRLASRSTGNLLAPSKPASWDVFASSGFAPTPADDLGLLSEAQLLHRAEALAAAQRRARPKPVSRLVGVSLSSVDEAFADLWLDSLDETRSTQSPCAAWPSMVLAPLERDVAAQLGDEAARALVRHLLVVEVLLPLEQRRPSLAPPPTLAPPPFARAGSSVASSSRDKDGAGGGFPGARWRRRASAIFSHSAVNLGEPPVVANGGPSGSNGARSVSSPPPSTSPTSPRRTRMSFGRPAPPFSSSSSRTQLAPAVPPIPSLPSSPSSGTIGGHLERGGGPGTFVRSISQGFASARRKTSRQSMYGGSAPAPPLEAPLEDQEAAAAVPVPSSPQRWESGVLPQVEAGGAGGDGEVRGYDVATPEGSPVLPRSSSGALLAPQSLDGYGGGAAREGAPPLGQVAVPSPVMEEQELFEGQPADMQRSASVDPLSGSPNYLESEPLAPQHGAAFDNLASLEPVLSAEPPLAAVGPPQLQPDAAPVDSIDQVDQVALAHGEASEPQLVPVVEQGQDVVPPPQVPETADLPALAAAEDPDAPPFASTSIETAVPAGEMTATAPGSHTPTDHPAKSLVVDQPETITAETPTSPLVTLSPPPVEQSNEMHGASEHEDELFKTDEDGPQHEVQQDPRVSAVVGLGLVDAPVPPAQDDAIAPATPSEDAPPSPSAHDPHMPSSTAMAQTLSAASARSGDSRSSLAAPKSPTPSTGSTSSTSSRKFLASVGGFLKRKKSTVSKEQAKRDKAEAAAREEREAKELRKLREEELYREIKERKAPTPVSNVKARVREIEEEEQQAVGSGSVVSPTSPTSPSRPASPKTPSRVRTASGGPRPATPTRSLARPGSMMSLRSAAASRAAVPDLPLPPIPALATNGTGAEAPHAGPAVPLVAPSAESTSLGAAAAGLPSLVAADAALADDDITGPVMPAVVDTPAQESQHLHVKVPTALEDLPSPLPSPTPRSASTDVPPLLAHDDDLTAPLADVAPPVFALATASEPVSVADVETLLSDPGEARAAVLPSIDVSSPTPAPQTPEHLHVKVPSALEDLPPPAPSPTPGANGHESGAAAVLVDEDVTETIPDVHSPVSTSVDTAGEGEEPVSAARAGEDALAPVEDAQAQDEDLASTSEVASRNDDDAHVEFMGGHAQRASDETVVAASDPIRLGEPAQHVVSPSLEPPSTPVKPSSSSPSSFTPTAHATPVAPATDDVFSAPPPASTAADATPTKPTAPLPHPLLRTSTSQYSMSTTRSFQTADSSAQSSATEGEWEPAASREAF
ncbi:hypothetical protein JCM3775_004738 [Rhodotorula graminis]